MTSSVLSDPFARLGDIVCPVSVVLGTGSISVRRCLTLDRGSVIPLFQSAGDDLQVLVGGVLVARGEVVIVEEMTAVRVTEIAASAAIEAAA